MRVQGEVCGHRMMRTQIKGKENTMNTRHAFSKRYEVLLHKAVERAGRERPPLLERKHLVSAVRDLDPRMFHRLLGRRSLYFTEELPLSGEEGKPTGEVAFSAGAYRVLSLHGGVLGEVMDDMGAVPVDIQHVAAALLLDSDEQGPVREWLRMNAIDPDARKAGILDAARKMGRGRAQGKAKEVLKKIGRVRDALRSRIVGQEQAIDPLCTALWQFWNTPAAERTRPLSLFIDGPAGSGKTLFAETLKAVIANLNGGKIIRTLNAGMYSSPDSSRDIVGLNESWKGGPTPGDVTEPILETPDGVICLEHVESLHSIALSHLLKAITEGSLTDAGTNKQVDFRNAIFIFISSAGGDGVSSGHSSKSRLAEELCHGITSPDAQRNIRALVEQSTLSIIMEAPKVADIRVLMRRTVEREFGSMKSFIRKIRIDADAVADILVQSISSLDARSLPSMVADVLVPVRKTMLADPDSRSQLKTLEVVVEGGPAYDEAAIARNLHMRKRLAIETSFEMSGKDGKLRIAAKGYSLLPAVADGIIRVTPPRESDSFDRLVGIAAPRAYTRRWERYFAGQTAIKPESLLLVGPPGCGKTSFVRALAANLGKPYVILNCNDLGSPKSLLAAFSTIRKYAQDGLLVCLDEIDSIAGDRDGKSEDYIERINLLLQQIDGFENNPSLKIMYIAATNRMAALDEAVVRAGRFGQTVMFAPLDESARRSLVKLAAEECKTCIDGELEDFMVETTGGLVPATIKAIIREMSVGAESRVPSKQDFLKARQVVLQGIFTQQTSLDDAAIHAVAVHEAGHALCCMQNGIGVVQASIVSAGDTLGFIEKKDSGMYFHTKEGLLAAIDVALAGRAAQELLIGQPTDGAINDIERATGLAMQYVRSGFSEYGLGIPPDGVKWVEISSIVRHLLEIRYVHVKQQMAKDKAALQRIVRLLLKHQILCEAELRKCFSKPGRSVRHG